ncbi:hydroxyacid dehydrogenase [Achromobacter insuavis]|uniref:hydroxyacid dehydrogenase n=1 Tax=Achromobacter insuavis TaxID=1287735 RepID=UPI001F12B4A1|nr:hydroxyacid dehydrogenase [Achromobacter insuavis]
MSRVLITMPVAAAGLRRLEHAGHELDLVERPSPAEFRARLARADAVILRFQALSRHDIEAAGKLRFVARHGVGYDAVDVAALTERGIALAITPGANAIGVAEHALALLLAVARRVIGHDAGVRAGQWQAALRGPMFELAGKTALIVGAGRIGRATAQRLRAFDMRVLAYDPFLPADAALPQGIEVRTDLAVALAEADVVSLHLPLTDATRGLIDPLALKRGAIVVNTARGGLLDPARLLAALESGHLTGAGLDVFDPEPPGAADALLRHPDVVLSPHAASLTDASIERMATECATNIIDFFEGRPPRDSIVNLAGIAL